MKTTCPCCKHEIETALPIVDLNTNTISFGDTQQRVQPQRAELATVLAERFPGLASYDHIIRRMWGLNEPEKPRIILKTHACSLRRVLRKIGFDIVTINDRGMRLEKMT